MRSDGKRPDDATVAPWKSEFVLVWDATFPDTLAASYKVHATSMSMKVAAAAEERKSGKYQGLPPGHSYVPIAIKALGAIDPRSLVSEGRQGNPSQQSTCFNGCLLQCNVGTAWLCWAALATDWLCLFICFCCTFFI